MRHFFSISNVFLIVGFLSVLFFSTYKLSEAPAIWYDEGFYTQMAKNFADTGKQVLQTEPGIYSSTSYVTVGYPLTATVGLSYKLFGSGVLQGRLIMALFLFGFVLASYFLFKKLFGKESAAWTVLLLATFPMLYGNGKAVLGEVPALFFLILTLLALSQLERNKYIGWHRYALVGLAAGLCLATKMFFVLLLIALFLTYLFNLRSIKLTWSGFIAGMIALICPLLLWAHIQFGAEATIQSVVSYYTNPYAVDNIPQHMLQNAQRFITETTPSFTLVLTSIWGISLFFRRKIGGISAAETGGFIFCILVILSYLRLEGWYRYLFPATMLSLLFLPNSLVLFYNFIGEKLSLPSYARLGVYAVLLLLAAGQLYQTSAISYVAQYYTGTRTHIMSEYLSSLSSASVFLYNTPELAIMLPTKNYYQYLTPLPEITIGENSLVSLRNGVPDVVIIASEAYASNPNFIAYKPMQNIDRYTILQRK